MDVADDVERPVQALLVVPEWLALDLHALDVLGLEDPDIPESLAPEALDRALEVEPLAPEHVWAELAVWSIAVAVLADSLRNVENDRDRQDVVLAGERDERLARVLLDVRGVDDRQSPGSQSLAGDVVQGVEGVAGRRLVVLVVGDQSPEEVGRHDLGRLEVRPGERRLAGPGRPDEDDQGQLRKVDPHRLKTAIWVGGPTSASSGPTGRYRTAYPKRSAIAPDQAAKSSRVHSNR